MDVEIGGLVDQGGDSDFYPGYFDFSVNAA